MSLMTCYTDSMIQGDGRNVPFCACGTTSWQHARDDTLHPSLRIIQGYAIMRNG